MAEGESGTFDILSLANTGIAKCVDQIYPLLYPQMIGLCGLSDCEELVRGTHLTPQTLARWVVGGVPETVVSKANSQDRRPLAPVIRLLKWYGR